MRYLVDSMTQIRACKFLYNTRINLSKVQSQDYMFKNCFMNSSSKKRTELQEWRGLIRYMYWVAEHNLYIKKLEEEAEGLYLR